MTLVHGGCYIGAVYRSRGYPVSPFFIYPGGHGAEANGAGRSGRGEAIARAVLPRPLRHGEHAPLLVASLQEVVDFEVYTFKEPR